MNDLTQTGKKHIDISILKASVPILFLLLSLHVFCQVKITTYSIHAFGISFSPMERLNGEIKIFANSGDIFPNINMELAGTYLFEPNEFHQFSAGIGLGLITESGEGAYISVPVALEIFPLQTFNKLSLIMELAPEIYINDDMVNLRHFWGIRYSF